MKRCLSVLLSLTGVLLLVAVVSACKPEARNSPSQQASTATTQPVATTVVGIAASTEVVTSTASKPPLCKFNLKSPTEGSRDSLDRYVFEEPSTILTSSVPSISLGIIQWLPDSQHLLITRKQSGESGQTIELLDTVTGNTKVYAHQQYGSGGFWTPVHQAVIYYERVPVDSEHGIWQIEYWASYGNPSQPEQLTSDALSTVRIDASSQSLFRWQSADHELAPVGNLSQLLTLRELPLDPSKWIDPKTLEESASENAWISLAKQPTGTLIALYDGSHLFLMDADTNQSCEIELRMPIRIASAEWSQDGRYLAMKTTTNLSGQPVSSIGLTVLDTITGQFYTPDLHGALVRQVSWIPKISNLLVTTDKRSQDGTLSTQVQLLDFVQGESRLLADNSKWNQLDIGPNPYWSPDGQRLVIGCPKLSEDGDLVAARICLISVSQH